MHTLSSLAHFPPELAKELDHGFFGVLGIKDRDYHTCPGSSVFAVNFLPEACAASDVWHKDHIRRYVVIVVKLCYTNIRI